MPGTTSTYDAVLKDVWAEGLRSQLLDDVPELDMFEEASTDDFNYEGKQLVIPVHLGRNRGSYFAAEGGPPPVAGNQKMDKLLVPDTYHYGGIQLNEQTIRATRSNRGAAANALTTEMERLAVDMRIQVSFALWGWGNGIRCLVNGAATTTTVTVDAPGGIAGATNGSRFINEGDAVMAINPATGGLRQAVAYTVTSVPAAGTTFVVDSAVTWTDNDWVVKAAGPAITTLVGTDFGHAPMGMTGLFDDGTYRNIYFGLSRTTYPIMQTTRISNVGTLSADALQRGFDVVLQRSGGKPTYLLTAPSTLRAYLTISEQERRYTGGDLMNPDIGTNAVKKSWDTGVAFGGVSFKRCVDSPYGVIVAPDTSSALRVVGDKGSWVDRDGSTFTRSTTAVDTFDAQWRIWQNFVVKNPNQSFVMDGINSTIVVVHRV